MPDTSKASARRREDSALTGLGTVFAKELTDNIGSTRMRVLEILVLFTGVGTVYAAIQDIKSITAQDPFLFLRLFTLSRDPLPSFIAFLSFLIPVISIGLGFDSINTEFAKRTISRVLAQPIYRDALLFGKFLAGLCTLGVGLVSLWLLVTGIGLFMLGVPPSGEEIARGLAFLVVALAYAGAWLSVAMLFSVIFRSPATSALCSLGLWMLFSILWPVMVPVLAQAIAPENLMALLYGMKSVEQLQLEQALSAFSPTSLFSDATLAILNPSTRALGLVFPSQLQGAVMGAPLPLGQSLLLAWPQITGLIALVIVMFCITYVVFQRQEVRA
jgi:ABC-2 type transport system permease protein